MPTSLQICFVFRQRAQIELLVFPWTLRNMTSHKCRKSYFGVCECFIYICAGKSQEQSAKMWTNGGGGEKKLIFTSFSFSFFWQDTGKQRGLLRATCSGRIVGKHFRTLNSWSGAAEANGPEGVFFSDWGSGRLRGSRKQKMRSSRPLDRGRDWERRGFFSLMDSRAVCMKYINTPRYIRSQSLSTCCLQKASVVLFPIWLFLGQLDRPFSYTHIVHDPWREPAFRFTAAPPKHKQTSLGFSGLRMYAHRPVSLCHGSLAPSVAGQLTCKTHSSVSTAWQSHKNIHGTLRSS